MKIARKTVGRKGEKSFRATVSEKKRLVKIKAAAYSHVPDINAEEMGPPRRVKASGKKRHLKKSLLAAQGIPQNSFVDAFNKGVDAPNTHVPSEMKKYKSTDVGDCSDNIQRTLNLLRQVEEHNAIWNKINKLQSQLNTIHSSYGKIESLSQKYSSIIAQLERLESFASKANKNTESHSALERVFIENNEFAKVKKWHETLQAAEDVSKKVLLDVDRIKSIRERYNVDKTVKATALEQTVMADVQPKRPLNPMDALRRVLDTHGSVIRALADR